jgi:alkylation response protein AidB-like acyl-CoA dehydrogenase
MDLEPSSEQRQLMASVAAFVQERMPVERVRALLTQPSSVDPAFWAECGALGLFALGLPEERGGSGGTSVEEALLMRELGRALTPGPVLGTVLASHVLAAAGPAHLAAAVIAGREPVALAVSGDALVVGDRVDGPLDLLDLPGCALVVVVTPECAAVMRTSDLRDVVDVPCLDDGTRLTSAVADGVPALAVVPAETEAVWIRGLVLSAAGLVGLAEAALDATVAHARSRVQFGQPIGAFQAVKHRAADMATAVEGSRALTFLAALALAEGRADAAYQALAARTMANRTAIHVAHDAVQLHGGMGFTFDCDIHLYLKRAHVLSRVLGHQHRHLADLLALPATL